MHGSRSFNFYTRQTRSRGIEALEAREMLTGVIVETLPLLVGGATTSPSPGAQLTSHAAVQVVHNFGDGRPDDRSLDVMEVGGTSYVHDPDSQEVVLALPDIPNPDEAWHEWRIMTAASNESEDSVWLDRRDSTFQNWRVARANLATGAVEVHIVDDPAEEPIAARRPWIEDTQLVAEQRNQDVDSPGLKTSSAMARLVSSIRTQPTSATTAQSEIARANASTTNVAVTGVAPDSPPFPGMPGITTSNAEPEVDASNSPTFPASIDMEGSIATETFTPAMQSTLLFYEDFESDLSEWDYGGTSDVCCDHSLNLVGATRSGTSSARFEHRLDDPSVNLGNRSELSLSSLDLQPDGEYWFGFSTYLPPDFQFEATDNLWHVAFQLHGIPDWDLGENWRSPPVALFLIEDRWELKLRSSADPVNDNDSAVRTSYHIPLEIGEWTDWAFHVKLSHETEGDGFAVVYQNGQQVVNHSGPTYYNDENGPYVKTGVYRSSSSTIETRQMLVDEIRIGTAAHTLADMQVNAPTVTANSLEISLNEGQLAEHSGKWGPTTNSISLSASQGTVNANPDGTWSWTQPQQDGPATQTVTITATNDADGSFSQAQFDIEILNVDPAFELGSNETLPRSAAGQFDRVGISVSDPGTLDTHTVTINYGDNSADETVQLNAGEMFNLSHTYSQEASYTVNVSVEDKDGATATDSFTVDVDLNDPPNAFDVTSTLNENSPNGTNVVVVDVSDPDAGDTVSFEITGGNTGNAFQIDDGGQITVADSTKLDFETIQVFNLSVTATDGGNLQDTATVTISLVDIDEEAPTILDVIVAGSTWPGESPDESSPNFVDAIDGGPGDGVGVGNGLGLSLPGPDQLRNLPWNTVDTIYVVFSEDVGSLTESDLELFGVPANDSSFGPVGDYKPLIQNIDYSPSPSTLPADSFLATISLTTPLGVSTMGFTHGDKLKLRIPDSLTDLAGNRLDGEWTDAVTEQSGNGSAAGDFEFRFDVLPGDLDDDDFVLGSDLLRANEHQGRFAPFESTSDPEYSPFNDPDADGLVLGSDIIFANSRQGDFLPFDDPML